MGEGDVKVGATTIRRALRVYRAACVVNGLLVDTLAVLVWSAMRP